jgi:phosphatidylserine decarboxylase
MKINKKILILILLGLLVGLAFYPSPNPSPNKYVERSSGIIKTEKVLGEKWLTWLYNNPVGEATMFTLVKRKFFSSLYGNMMDSPYSAKKILPFIEEYNIDINIAQNQEFNSFNEFFTRKLKNDARPINNDSNIVISPADGKILAYSNISNSNFIIKGYRFDVRTFLDDTNLAKKYKSGSLVVIRLAPYDYHRFHFPVNGKILSPTLIDGDLYSVNPMALRQMADIFLLNKREYTIISTKQFGDVIMAEVGATMVGSIIQTYTGDNILKGKEKGYFKFGGSTVVLLFEENKIIIDSDLLKNTENGLETEVKMGERIASLGSEENN